MKTEEKLQLAKKAYRINNDRLDEGYLFDTMFCYAKNQNKARKTLFKQYKNYEYKLQDGTEITYLNIPVVRNYENDLYWFEGEEIKIKHFKTVLGGGLDKYTFKIRNRLKIEFHSK